MAKLNEAIQIEATKHPLQGKTRFAGMPISIENKKGSTRSGVDAFGKPWSVKMPFDYGYIGRTKGPDGDAYDCFIGPNASAKFAYVVHQCKQTDRDKWDEDKVMLGFDSADAAIRAYKSAYNNVDLFHSMTVMPMSTFKKKVAKTYGHKRHDKLHAGGPGSGRHSTLIHNRGVDGGWLSNGHKLIVKLNGKKIGEAGVLEHNREGKKIWSVTTARVNSNLVGKGFGKHVYAELIKQAKNNGVNTLKSTDAHRSPGAEHAWSKIKNAVREKGVWHLDIKAVNYGGDVGYDYRQFREGTAIQPITNAHPPSLKNPIRVPSDNPDDKEDKYKDKKKRRSKATRDFYKELARRQSDKPEIANTTAFVPLSQG